MAEETEGPDFGAWRPIIDAARNVAEQYDSPYREIIFEALLHAPAGQQVTRDIQPAPASAPDDDGMPAPAATNGHGLTAAAQAADVPVDALRRVVEINEEEGDLELLVMLDGNSTSEKANRAAAVYAFLREQIFGDQEVGIEELRELCKRQRAYDSANFTKNFRNNGLLLERGKTGSPKKWYRLSPRGVEEAKEILREKLEPEE